MGLRHHQHPLLTPPVLENLPILTTGLGEDSLCAESFLGGLRIHIFTYKKGRTSVQNDELTIVVDGAARDDTAGRFLSCLKIRLASGVSCTVVVWFSEMPNCMPDLHFGQSNDSISRDLMRPPECVRAWALGRI